MPDTLHREIGQVLMLISRDFQTRLDKDLRARGIPGIGKRHSAIFLHLGKNGASRSVDLAHAVGIRPQSMMVIVHEMEELGLIERKPDPMDSRAKLIDFTQDGRHLINELARSTTTVWQHYKKLLGEKNLTRTFNGLSQLLNAIDE